MRYPTQPTALVPTQSPAQKSSTQKSSIQKSSIQHQALPALRSLPAVQHRESDGSRSVGDNIPGRQTGIPPLSNSTQPAKAGRTVNTVPAVLYEKVVAELEQARRKVQQLAQTNQTLENHNETLAQELQQVASELQGDVYRALTRLQILAEANQGSVQAQASINPSRLAPVTPTPASSYSFLDRLKTRQQDGVALESQPSGQDNAALAPDIDPLDPFAEEEGEQALASLESLGSVSSDDVLGSTSRAARSRPSRPRSTRASSRTRILAAQANDPIDELTEPGWDSKNWRGSQASQPSARSGPLAAARRSQRPSLREEISPEEELFGSGIPTRDQDQDLTEDLTASGYGTSVYHRGRNRQSAQQSLWIWGILSLLLVTGCFTAGFFVVQSVVRGGNSAQPVPSSNPL
ncbi:MAG: hypothetical protein HC924_13330 [Synechococcaceae cyanobacterium SM2_3_2]|nr:hypothetical protein [Synechococcaceae cyanobacterium SM2_3_2]